MPSVPFFTLCSLLRKVTDTAHLVCKNEVTNYDIVLLTAIRMDFIKLARILSKQPSINSEKQERRCNDIYL